jgi:hypothetical protein
MKKTILIAALVLAALAVTGAGVAFAQGEAHGGKGLLHPFIVEAFTQKLDLTVEDVNARLAAGETLYDIALSEGVAEADIPALLEEVHNAALDAAVEAGVITQEQADWMKAHNFGRRAAGSDSCGGGGGRGNHQHRGGSKP